MPTSGTSIFNLDLNNLIEEAFERCGSELRSGYDLRTAGRTLNLLTIEWANRGINLWTIEQGTIPLVTGQAIYPVPVDTIQLLDTVIRQNPGTLNQTDINISNIAEPTYSSIPNKLTQGRPIQYWFNRQSGNENPTTITLAADISATATTIQLSNVDTLASAGFIKIDNETIGYSNISGNQLQYCVRGANNTTAAPNGLDWVTEAYVVRISSGQQTYSSFMLMSTTPQDTTSTAISITDTASIVIKVTGQNGTANAGDISCRAMTVEVL